MAAVIEAGPSRAASGSVEPSTSSSASTLLRTLKSSQLTHDERIATARQALEESKIPRAVELVRQWILDEWLAPSKSSTAPSIIQPVYHDLFARVNGPASSPPFAVLVRCISELEKHATPIRDAPWESIRTMVVSHTQTSTYARWVELWAGLVAWLAAPGVIDGASNAEVQQGKELSDAVFQHVAESSDTVQAEATSIQVLVKTIPHLATILSRQPALGEHLSVSLGEMLRSLPPDALDQFLLPSFSPSHTSIAHLLPLLLRCLADTRSRARYTIFSQPSSSKVAYETHIATAMQDALYRDFAQVMAFLEGVAVSGAAVGDVWEARRGCWEEIRRLDVRIEGQERWRVLVLEAARGARAVLAGKDEGAVKICLRLLACLSVLDYDAAGVSDVVVQLCLQQPYLFSAEGNDLLLALLHHHRLIRAPATYITLLCRCISTSSPTTTAGTTAMSTNSNISSTLLGAIHELITYGGETHLCWRTLISTSEDLLARPESTGGLNAFAGLLAALVVSGCPKDVLLELGSVWTLDSNALRAIEGGKAGKKGKSKAASSSEREGRLSALLIVRSAVRGEVEKGVLEDLKAAMKEESISEELDIAICRFLLAMPIEVLSESSIIDALLARLAQSDSSAEAYWPLITGSVISRFESHTSDTQLETLGQALLAHSPASRQLWRTTSFWELTRLTKTLARLAVATELVDPSISFALPHTLQTPAIASRLLKQAGQEAYTSEMVKLWLEQASAEALAGVAVDDVLVAMLDHTRRELSRVIVSRVLQNSPNKFPESLVQLIRAVRTRLESGKPTLDSCAAAMQTVSLLTGRKWASIPTEGQTDLKQIAAVSAKALQKGFKKSPEADVEAKGNLWLDLHAFSVWSSAEQTSTAPFPEQLLHSMLANTSSNSTLVLRLIAAKGDSELLIATYLFLRSQTSASIATVDGTMSDLIQSASPDMYASFWQAARGSAAGGSLLSLLLSNTREGEPAPPRRCNVADEAGSGKVVRGHLGPILASIQAGPGNPGILSALWRHRAILFDDGQAIDSWVTFSGIFLSSPSSETASDLLDAATSFTQQRSDLLPFTSSAIASSICSVFTYLRGRVDVPLAQKVARFLDSLGRGAGTVTIGKRKSGGDDSTTSRQKVTRAMARHVPVILVAYARATTDPVRNISATSRRVIDGSLAELCMSTDAATGKAFDSTGLPYGLGEGLAGEAESAVWAQIWRSWKKKRYTGQG